MNGARNLRLNGAKLFIIFATRNPNLRLRVVSEVCSIGDSDHECADGGYACGRKNPESWKRPLTGANIGPDASYWGSPKQ